MKNKVLIVFLSFVLFFSGVASASNMPKSNDVPVFNSIEEREASGDDSDVFRIKPQSKETSTSVQGLDSGIKPAYQGGYYEYKYVRTAYDYNKNIGYHPSFPNWLYSDGYWFSNSSTVSMSFNIGYGWFSVGVAASNPSSGFFRDADGKYKSRPYVRADVTTKIYDMYIYDDFGKLISISREYYKTTTTSDVQIFVGYL